MKAYLILFFVVMLWGLNFHFGKIMLQDVNFIEAGFWRYIFGVLALLFFTIKKLPTLYTIKKKFWVILGIGAFGIFGYNLFFFLSLIKGSAMNAALIISLNPAVTLILSTIFLKTKLRFNHIIGVIIAFSGAFYLILKGDINNLSNIHFTISDIYISIACVIFASYHVSVKKYAVDIPNKHFTLLTNFVCLLVLIVVLPFYGENFTFPYKFSFWYSAVGIGVVGTAITYYLWNYGIELAGADKAGIFLNFIPLSTAFFGIFFHEKLYEYHLVSGLIILGGLLIMNIKLRKRKNLRQKIKV
ncbi:DMT family transporter [Aureivirga sp. CE67]|uniref:DMT family transporter n=1 Tax=Aureivirga sp. CE67 TaxID=1788983 RepID=UPI0018CA9276|nr:DMT family transporter [Aureivirga sp. CE67]